jgi:hypothetical protein
VRPRLLLQPGLSHEGHLAQRAERSFWKSMGPDTLLGRRQTAGWGPVEEVPVGHWRSIKAESGVEEGAGSLTEDKVGRALA